MNRYLLASLFIGYLPFAAAKDPYQNVSLVTKTIAWPYNKATFGNDSFQKGSVESGDTDSLLLESIDHGLKLPDDFRFGVALAAYQYEGARLAPSLEHPDGLGWSMWDVFNQKGSWLNPKGTNISEVAPTATYTKPSGEEAILGYKPEYYQEDVHLAKQLGTQVFRLSISWPRLFPHKGMKKPDPEGLRYYHHLLKTLKSHGFDVFITLYHWDLPAWLYNYGDPNIPKDQKTYGWLDMAEAKDNLTLKEYQKYVESCFEEFGQYTPYFATFNEPLTFTNSGLLGSHAPGKEGFDTLRQLNPVLYGHNAEESDKRLNYLQAANVIKAHYIAYKTFEPFRQAIRTANQGKEPMLGLVVNSDWAEPYRIIQDTKGQLAYHPDDIKASQRHMDFMLGWWLNPIMYGDWPESMKSLVGNRLPSLHKDSSCLSKTGEPVACMKEDQRLSQYIQSAGALDYLSLNHYTGYFVADLDYAKDHFSEKVQEESLPPSQYQETPKTLMPGWSSDQKTFVTQFRYQKYGTSGPFADPHKNRVYVIGKAGAQPWLRHTFFSYTKLLNFIDTYYMKEAYFTKQHKPFTDLGFYLTENGTSLYGESQKTGLDQLADEDRITFIKGNLAAVWQAMQDGVPVKLYTYWSLFDNFEWAEGYDSRFGLVWIDYEHQMQRLLKNSFYYYQQVIATKSVLP